MLFINVAMPNYTVIFLLPNSITSSEELPQRVLAHTSVCFTIIIRRATSWIKGFTLYERL